MLDFPARFFVRFLANHQMTEAFSHPRWRVIEGGSREGAARIELADLKERIRKLEAIASGVDL